MEVERHNKKDMEKHKTGELEKLYLDVPTPNNKNAAEEFILNQTTYVAG